MSTQSQKGDNLPPLQLKIILFLAKNGPQTINETVQKIKHHYKATWIAFNSLEKKGLLKKVNIKLYRGREYPQFWLTFDGIKLSLINGASPNSILENVQKNYPDCKEKENIGFILELWQISPSMRKYFEQIFHVNGLAEINFKLISVSLNPKSEEFKEIQKVFKKYPRLYKIFSFSIRESKQQLIELEKVLEHE